MIYESDSKEALYAMEQQSMIDSLNIEETKYCEICGAKNPEYFNYNRYTEEYVGCSECMDMVDWGNYFE